MKRFEYDKNFKKVIQSAETSLGLDLNCVRVKCRPAAAIGGLAKTEKTEITLSHEAVSLPADQFEFIVAHELVHVAQKVRGASLDQVSLRRALNNKPNFVAAIEQEANELAVGILNGVSSRCSLADLPGRPAFWGELGHYYTTYYIMLAAGCDAQGARTRAFFSQVPDEVRQFDATCATRDYHEFAPNDHRYRFRDVAISAGTDAFEIPRATPKDQFQYNPVKIKTTNQLEDPVEYTVSVEDPVAKAKRRARDLTIIRGLHCLTGRSSSEETSFRIQTVQENWKNPVISGIALHALGDSFAHRKLFNEEVMYNSEIGHAHNVHEPDYLSQRPLIYLAYAKALYKIVASHTHTALPFEQTIRPTLERLLEVKGVKTRYVPTGGAYGTPTINRIDQTVKLSGEEADEAGIKILKDVLSRMGGYDPTRDPKEHRSNYSPENHSSIYWKEFAAKHNAIMKINGGADNVLASVYAAGETWAKRIAKVNV